MNLASRKREGFLDILYQVRWCNAEKSMVHDS